MNKEYYGVKDLPKRAVFRKNGEIITIMDFIEKFNWQTSYSYSNQRTLAIQFSLCSNEIYELLKEENQGFEVQMLQDIQMKDTEKINQRIIAFENCQINEYMETFGVNEESLHPMIVINFKDMKIGIESECSSKCVEVKSRWI